MATAGFPEAGATPTNDPAATVADGAAETEKTWSDNIKTIGGLVAVVVGVVAVLVITIVAIAKNTATAGTIASAGAGVIASIVGAFFGVKIGSDQARTANEAERKQAAKATVFAAHLPEGKARDVLAMAESVVRGGSSPTAPPPDERR